MPGGLYARKDRGVSRFVTPTSSLVTRSAHAGMTEPKEKRACPLRVLRHQVTPARRFVTPSRRLVTPARRFVTYRSPSGKFTVRRVVSLPFVER